MKPWCGGTAEYDGTQWSVSYDEDPLGMPGPGIPAGFVVFGVMTVLVGI